MAFTLLSKLSCRCRPLKSWAGPRSVMIEPTNFCNLHCPGCPTGLGILERPKRNLKFSEFRLIYEKIRPRPEKLLLWGYGEPFLNPAIFAMISLAAAQGSQVITSTNGHFLQNNTEKISQALLHKLIISLDGASATTYQRYRQHGDFNQVVKNIKALTHTQERQSQIEIQFIVMRHNEHEIAMMKKLAKKLKVDRLVFKSVWFLDPRLRQKYASLLPRHKKMKRRLSPTGTGWCRRPWYHFTVLADGQVTPCCYDTEGHLNLGNLLKDSFTAVWQGTDFQEYRRHMKEQIKGHNFYYFCRHCPENSARRLTL